MAFFIKFEVDNMANIAGLVSLHLMIRNYLHKSFILFGLESLEDIFIFFIERINFPGNIKRHFFSGNPLTKPDGNQLLLNLKYPNLHQ